MRASLIHSPNPNPDSSNRISPKCDIRQCLEFKKVRPLIQTVRVPNVIATVTVTVIVPTVDTVL